MNRNNQEEITELQTMLRRIAQIERKIPPVRVTGVYDEQTREAVTAFQEAYGLPPTGTVDGRTWEEIVTVYRVLSLIRGPRSPIFAFPGSDYAVRREEESETALFVQILLRGISTTYDTYYNIEPSGVYDRETEEAIYHFQKVNRLPETGEVDALTWDTLADNYNTFGHNGRYQS